MNQRTPFTYLVTHIESGIRYYGARYSRNCHPNDLGTTYFSSSRRIKRLIKEEGIGAFKFEIRRVFSSPEEAVSWESRFLKKVDAAKSTAWFNMHNGDGNFFNKPGYSLTEKTKEKMRKPKSETHRIALSKHLSTNRKIPDWTDTRKKSQSDMMKGNKFAEGTPAWNRGKSCPQCGIKGNQFSKGFFWWNNGVERVRSKTQPEGFVRGRGVF